MANTKEQVKEEVVNIEELRITRSPQFVSLYINNTQFAYTKWDIQMVCGRVTVTLDRSQNPLEEIASIAMSPVHAKAVLLALQANITSYEAEHGEIIMRDTQAQVILDSDSHKNKK